MDLNPDGFYSWWAHDEQGCGAGGVTAESRCAAELLVAALQGLSTGATGSVRVVRLDRHAPNPSYLHGVVVMRAERDTATGDIVLDDARPPRLPGPSLRTTAD